MQPPPPPAPVPKKGAAVRVILFYITNLFINNSACLVQNNINYQDLFYVIMQKSYKEVRKRSIKENIALHHPYIPCVLFDCEKCICEEHPERVNMNLGSLKGHIKGKDHYLNFDTGEPIPKTKKETLEFPNSSDVITIEPTKNQPNNETLDLMTRLKYIFPTNEFARRVIAAQTWFEGKILEDIDSILTYEIRSNLLNPEPRKDYDLKFLKSILKYLLN